MRLDAGTLAMTAGGIDLTQAVKLNTGGGTLQIGAGLSDTISGVISNGNGPGYLTKNGAGTLTLSGINIFSGATTITGGTVNIAAAANLGTGQITLDAGTLAMTASGIDLTQGVRLNTGGGTVQVGAGLSNTISGAIIDSNGTGSLTKTGAGILRLSGVNTTISAGALILSSGAVIEAGVTNNATFTTAGTVSGGVRNAGTVNAASGALNGAIANTAGYFNVSGTLTSNSTFGNAI